MTEIDQLDGQIDIEEAIAAAVVDDGSRLTVAQYVELTGWPEWSVRRAIKREYLVVDREQRPMVITGGEMPLTVREWQLALDPELRRLQPSRWAWSDGGRQLSILPRDNVIRVFRLPLTKAASDDQARELRRMDIPRKTA